MFHIQIEIKKKMKLTQKEEEIMNFFWAKNEPIFVKEIWESYAEPKPHINTLSTIVRGLEEKKFLSHKAYGSTYQYYVVITKEQFTSRSLKDVIGKYYNNSLFSAMSSLVADEAISVEELHELIEIVEKGR